MAKFYGVQTGSTQASPSMIRVIRICRKCGAKIFSDVPEGLCPRCVLKSALTVSLDAPVAGGDSSAEASAKADDSGCAHGPSRDEAKAAASDSNRATRAAGLLGELGDYELLEEIGR